MANDSAPNISGTESSSPAPTVLDYAAAGDFLQAANLLIENAKRAALQVDRTELQAYQQLSDNIVISPVVTAVLPAAKQIVQNVRVAVGDSAAIVQPPGITAQQNQATGADPVDLATGQLLYSFTDMHLDGAGMDFDLVRNYRSGSLYPNGPFGSAWDHNLNLWLREVSATEVVVSNGNFREDHFTWVQGTNDDVFYFAPPDGYHATLQKSNFGGTNIYVLTRPDGLQYQYVSLFDDGVFKIQKIVDRFGNFLYFDYSNLPLLSITVNDSNVVPFRVINILFDEYQRITEVTDYSGRTVTYDYDDYDDLVAIILPATKDYPLGRVMYYEYDSAEDSTNHLLTSVVDTDGRRYLEVEYGKNINFVDQNRVIRQRDDEGEWLIEYADLELDDSEDPNDVSIPNRYGIMVKPTGHCIECWFNKNGNALVKAETCSDEDGGLQQYITRTLYNADGNIIALLSPGNLMTQYVYGRDLFEENYLPGTVPTQSERQAFGNLLTRIGRANTGFTQTFDAVTGEWVPPSPFTYFEADDIIIDFTYEPVYQLLLTKSDPRYRGDSHYYTQYQYSALGELLRVIYPKTTGPDPADTTKDNVIDWFAYDPGQPGRVVEKRLKHMDPLLGLVDHPDNHTTQYKYFNSYTKKGFLSKTITGVGETDEATIARDVNERGIQVSVTDPMGGSTEFDIDTHDKPVTVTRRLNAATAYVTSFKYTNEVKPLKVTRPVEDASGNDLLGEPEIRWFKYNDFGLLLSERLGGNDYAATLNTRKTYNSEGLPERLVSPTGSISLIHYEARRLPIKTVAGFGNDYAVTAHISYDANAKQRSVTDGAGNVTRYDYDHFGRPQCTVQVADIAVGTIDDRPLQNREGHSRVQKYDKLNNIVEERFFEWVKPSAYRLLSVKGFVYDARGRKIKTVAYLFKPGAMVTVGADWFNDLASYTIPPSTQVESWIFYDGNGKIKEQRDGVVTSGASPSPGSSVAMAYDHSRRLLQQSTKLLDKNLLVTETQNSYDLNGNLLRTDVYDYEYDMFGVFINTEVISAGSSYDALNRRISEMDALRNTITYEYDSRDKLIKKTDPLGNIVTFEYDVYGRKILMQESPDGSSIIKTSYTYDADNQLILVSRGDQGSGIYRETAFLYNALHKMIQKTLGAGTPMERIYTYEYNGTGLLQRIARPDGLIAAFTYNELNLAVRIDYDTTSTPAVIADKKELFLYDGLGRLLETTNDSSQLQKTYDSLGREIEEDQKLIGDNTLTITRKYDFLGNYASLMYPSGRKLSYQYDLARRQFGISDTKRGTPNVSKAGAGIRHVLQRTFVGRRVRHNTYANGVKTIYDYDANARVISTLTQNKSNTSLLQLLTLYDANGNRAADWQAGTQASAVDNAYAYDGLNRLLEAGKNKKPLFNVAAFAPPAAPKALGGQSMIDAASGTLSGTIDAYGYDTWSNRATEKFAAGNQSLLFDELNEVNDSAVAHDLNGNLVQSGAKTFAYDQHNRLVSVTNGASVFRCSYDPGGRRITIGVGTDTKRFCYDRVTEIASYLNGTLNEEYVLSSEPDGRISYASGGNDYVLHHDSVASTRMITKSTGGVQGRYDYEPYGHINRIKKFSGFRYLFMGREWDDAIELYCFRARHYDLDTGRFIQTDPAGSQDGKSLYQAFGSNPLIFVDPLGTRQKNIIRTNNDGDLTISGLFGTQTYLPAPLEGLKYVSDPSGTREAEHGKPESTRKIEEPENPEDPGDSEEKRTSEGTNASDVDLASTINGLFTTILAKGVGHEAGEVLEHTVGNAFAGISVAINSVNVLIEGPNTASVTDLIVAGVALYPPARLAIGITTVGTKVVFHKTPGEIVEKSLDRLDEYDNTPVLNWIDKNISKPLDRISNYIEDF